MSFRLIKVNGPFRVPGTVLMQVARYQAELYSVNTCMQISHNSKFIFLAEL